jgi:hypothetical protein
MEKRSMICLFKDVIRREAFRLSLPVIDLRLVCTSATDHARAISRLVTECDFRSEGSKVFV